MIFSSFSWGSPSYEILQICGKWLTVYLGSCLNLLERNSHSLLVNHDYNQFLCLSSWSFLCFILDVSWYTPASYQIHIQMCHWIFFKLLLAIGESYFLPLPILYMKKCIHTLNYVKWITPDGYFYIIQHAEVLFLNYFRNFFVKHTNKIQYLNFILLPLLSIIKILSYNCIKL